MRLFLLLVLAAPLACATPESSGDGGPPPQAASDTAPPDTVRTDWGAFFAAVDARGTFVMLETETGQVSRYNPERAATRVTPASTSKLFNALVFLDRGVVTDVDSVLVWDGVERRIANWNRDNSLRTGVEYSVVWLFQRLALEVGRDGYDEVFARQPYGNSTMGEPLDMAWLDGSLLISAEEQIAFVDGLRRGTLGFSPEAQATVRAITPELASGDGWRLLAKTGWGFHDGQDDIGWLVGWVEREAGDVVFAMNMEASGEDSTLDLGPERLRLVRAILASEGIIEA